jgi:hypothetical protein
MFHAASNRVQRKASIYLEIDLNYSEEQFHLKGSLESCAASLKQSTKSSSPINIRLQQEEHILFEQKEKEPIHQESLCLQITQELYLWFEQAALFMY